METTGARVSEIIQSIGSVVKIPIYIMGTVYEVPGNLTIMKAVEEVGYQYIRGCGCRGGICGACGTFYRVEGDYHLKTGLACQTLVEPGMMIMQIPFFPVNRPDYDLENTGKDLHEDLREHFPEVFKCVGCSTCTRTCPMDIDVMDYIALMKRGEFEKAAEESFNCIMCGLCAVRCPAQISQHTAAMYVRRVVGRYISPRAKHLEKRVTEVRTGQYSPFLAELKGMEAESWRQLYSEMEREPDLSKPAEWMPQETKYLIVEEKPKKKKKRKKKS